MQSAVLIEKDRSRIRRIETDILKSIDVTQTSGNYGVALLIRFYSRFIRDHSRSEFRSEMFGHRRMTFPA
jgi:hypothetical protein